MSEYNMSHTGQELDAAINKVKSGYILPAGNTTITTNGTHDVTSVASAVVNVPVINGIDPAQTPVAGTIEPSSDTAVSSLRPSDFPTLTFMPRIFVLYNEEGMNTTSSTLYLTLNYFVADDAGNVKSYRTSGMFCSSGKASSVQGSSIKHSLIPTTNGVTGNGSSTIYLKGGTRYAWKAWR